MRKGIIAIALAGTFALAYGCGSVLVEPPGPMPRKNQAEWRRFWMVNDQTTVDQTESSEVPAQH